MVLSPKKLGLGAAVASAIYQVVMFCIAFAISFYQYRTVMLGSLSLMGLVMSLVSILLTCLLHFCYAYVLAVAYNRL